MIEVLCFPWWAPGITPEFLNEVTHDGLLESFKMGAGQARKTNLMIRGLGLWPPDTSPTS